MSIKFQQPFYAIMALVLMAGVVFSSCTSSEDPATPEVNHSGGENVKIRSMLEIFYQQVHPATRAIPGFIISDIKANTYSLSTQIPEAESDTRVETEDDYKLYTVTMEFENSTGFAIVSDDPRIEEVFFFTENGAVSDTAYIAPLKELIDIYPAMAAEIILNGKTTRSTPNLETTVIDDVAKFKWGQSYPFNQCAPYCTCAVCSTNDRKNHQLAGCVTIAVGQYLATRGHFYGTYYPNEDRSFTDEAYVSGSLMNSLQGSIVANFLREIAHNCQIRFGCTASSGSAHGVYNYLKEIGIDCQLSKGTLTGETILNELSQGIPHIICGDNGEVGHMWLITGIKYDKEMASGTLGNFAYLCNWGWNGNSNGWTFGYYYTPTGSRSYSKNHTHIITKKW